ncbi:hypothetical protein ACQCT2_14610, partial [Staphylococcus shinii]
MIRNWRSLCMVFAAVVLILSTFSFSAQATGTQSQKVEIAKYFGEIKELNSGKFTTVIVELKEPSMMEAKDKGKKQTKKKLKKARDGVKAEVGKKTSGSKVYQ